MKTRQCDPISGGFCVLPRVPCKPARLCSEKPWARGERLHSRPGPTGDTGLQVGPRNTFPHLPLFVHQGGRGGELRSRAPLPAPPQPQSPQQRGARWGLSLGGSLGPSGSHNPQAQSWGTDEETESQAGQALPKVTWKVWAGGTRNDKSPGFLTFMIMEPCSQVFIEYRLCEAQRMGGRGEQDKIPKS